MDRTDNLVFHEFHWFSNFSIVDFPWLSMIFYVYGSCLQVVVYKPCPISSQLLWSRITIQTISGIGISYYGISYYRSILYSPSYYGLLNSWSLEYPRAPGPCYAYSPEDPHSTGFKQPDTSQPQLGNATKTRGEAVRYICWIPSTFWHNYHLINDSSPVPLVPLYILYISCFIGVGTCTQIQDPHFKWL